MSDCPCGSGQAYDACCGPIISKKIIAPTAEALMRSRYSAYAKVEVDHLYDSLAPGTRDDFNHDNASQWAESATWTGLDVAAIEGGGEGDDQGMVEFTAHYEQDGEPQEHREKGLFKKIDKQWYYVDGKVLGHKTVVKEKKVGRNQSCPCGSGKKFKKCCG